MTSKGLGEKKAYPALIPVHVTPLVPFDSPIKSGHKIDSVVPCGTLPVMESSIRFLRADFCCCRSKLRRAYKGHSSIPRHSAALTLAAQTPHPRTVAHSMSMDSPSPSAFSPSPPASSTTGSSPEIAAAFVGVAGTLPFSI